MDSIIGSISQGTHREEDLIPCFVETLAELVVPADDRDGIKLCCEIASRMTDVDYYESEEVMGDMESLFEALESYAPPFFRFGAHEGDGANFGFWFCEQSMREAQYEEEAGSGDELPDSPDAIDGILAFFVVTDHGNITYYDWNFSANAWEEIWAIV